MSNSQEQSLDENAVFLPVNESSPEFLHCEKERQAVETLLNAGPEAFYTSVGTDRSGCFLSPAEVGQITDWAQDYRLNPLQVQNGQGGVSETEDFCSTYFPSFSDTPAPDLELGWPEKGPWVPKGSVTVHTNPPAEGEPHVRQIVRRHLQKAGRVIAVVTDRLTDGAIIGDLHNAAARGVPVYIILNQRSIQENFMLNRLRHPNMRVRALGGKTFCSKTGRMAVGEMKNKFLLVDLETVIHGSYSFSWTDTHLHRQLITVICGPVVDSFDREFRILFAASLPVADTWRPAGPAADVTPQLKERSDLVFQRHLKHHLEAEITSPPSPPADSPLDWEAMGVVHRDRCFQDSPVDQHEGIMAKDSPLKRIMLFDKNPPIMDGFINNGNQFVEKKRLFETISPVTNAAPDKSTTFNNKQPSSTDPATPERMKRVEHIINKTIFRQLSAEKIKLDDRTTTRPDDKAAEATHNVILLSSSRRRDRSQSEAVLDEERRTNEISSKVENTPSSRKPIILRMPQSESFSSLSDIMKRIQPQQSTSGPLRKGSKVAVSEISQSMMNLSVHNTDNDRGSPVPRFKSTYFDPDHVTPALALMKKRNDELKPSLYRTPKNFFPRERPRNSTFALKLDWRRSLTETEGETE